MLSELGRRLAGLAPGSHLCTIYETTAEQVDAAVWFLKEGLARGERGLVIGENENVQAVLRAMADDGVDVAREQDRGTLQLVTDRAIARLNSGGFAPRRMVDFLRESDTQAIADGFAGLRVAEETTWAIGLDVPLDRLLEFEVRLDQFLASSRTVVLCQYDRRRFDPTVIDHVLRTHAVAILGDQVCPNPYHEPPALLLGESRDPTAERLEWRIRQLRQARAAEQERERIEAALRISEARSLKVFSHAAIGMEIMTPEGKYLAVNPAACAMSGYTEAEFLCLDFREVTHPDDIADCEQLIGQMLAGELENIVIVKRFIKKSGEIAWHQSSVSLMRDAEGRPQHIVALVEDITRRKVLEHKLREQASHSQALARRVVEVQEEERRRLARELHDEIGQALTAIGINLRVLDRACSPEAQPRLEDSRGLVRRAIEQVRGLALDLRPSVLDDFGLAAALGWLVERQAQRAGLIGHFSAPTSGPELQPDLAVACFRVAQEALTNVVRHSRAKNVWVRLRQSESEVRLTIRDDGIGFDPDEARARASRGTSLGLLGIRERAEMLGGRVAIESEPGHGACIRLWLAAKSPSP